MKTKMQIREELTAIHQQLRDLVEDNPVLYEAHVMIDRASGELLNAIGLHGETQEEKLERLVGRVKILKRELIKSGWTEEQLDKILQITEG